MRTTEPLEAYAPLRAELERQWSQAESEPVDSEPRIAAEALLTLVDNDDRRCGCCSAAWSTTSPSTSPGSVWTPGRGGRR
ncbi:hypothetical protein [Streptomonospora salina]|uniref:Uncharacterized protein n=1 Tax=Streptomonospora salina TaxID=104205 RepID=A0A841EIV8_9ACTN|nr:hypothetical protein [Streptomonospora salina]MBB5999351.1 hypothetical protein [Streptomonospora salina]